MSGMINNKLESLSSKSTCLEDTVLLEENSFCQLSCLGSDRGCNDDIVPVKLGYIFLGPSTNFQSGEVIESLSSDQTEYVDLSSDCQTPAESIFDPFAPGLEDLMLAPKKKMMKATYVPFGQQLNFDFDSDSVESIETNESGDFDAEEHFSEFIFSSLLELIISTQLLEISVKNQVSDYYQPQVCNTPTSLPLLTGIAETCPPAPLKPTLSVKRLSHSIRRKLDFGSTLTEL